PYIYYHSLHDALPILESSIYRVAGDMETVFSQGMKEGISYSDMISKFIIECSLNKVFSTESLDFIADEAVQIHGGYGYMKEYEVDRKSTRLNSSHVSI